MPSETTSIDAPEEFKSANPQPKDGDQLFSDKEIAHSVALAQKSNEEVMSLQRKVIADAEPGSYDDKYGSIALATNEVSDAHETAALKETHDALVAARPDTIEDIKDGIYPGSSEEDTKEVVASALSSREDDAIKSTRHEAIQNDPRYDKAFDQEVLARAESIQAREKNPVESQEQKAA